MSTTIPEAPETIEAQLEWLVTGKRKAVLLTPGCVLPELPKTLSALIVKEGLVIYDLSRTIAPEIQQHSRNNTLGELLGYGVATKPAQADRLVTVRGPNGHEKQAVAADSKRLDDAWRAAKAVAGPGDTVQVEHPDRVIEDRLRSLDARELKVRPYDAQRDARALDAAAKADAHAPLNPTHVIEREGEIVGYFGVNSLPLYRLWFHSEKLKASDSLRLLFMIENQYRMAGVGIIGTIINTESPFYPCAARGGYLECQGDRLFLKPL